MKIIKIDLFTGTTKNKTFMVKLEIKWDDKSHTELVLQVEHKTVEEAIALGQKVGAMIMSGELPVADIIKMQQEKNKNPGGDVTVGVGINVH